MRLYRKRVNESKKEGRIVLQGEDWREEGNVHEKS